MPPKKSSGLLGSLAIVQSRGDESRRRGHLYLSTQVRFLFAMLPVLKTEDSGRREDRQRCKPMIPAKGISTTDE